MLKKIVFKVGVIQISKCTWEDKPTKWEVIRGGSNWHYHFKHSLIKTLWHCLAFELLGPRLDKPRKKGK